MHKKDIEYLFPILLMVIRNIHTMEEGPYIQRYDEIDTTSVISKRDWGLQVIHQLTKYSDNRHEHPLVSILNITSKDSQQLPIIEISKIDFDLKDKSKRKKVAELVKSTISNFFSMGFNNVLMNRFTYQKLQILEITNYPAQPTEDGTNIIISPPEPQENGLLEANCWTRFIACLLYPFSSHCFSKTRSQRN